MNPSCRISLILVALLGVAACGRKSPPGDEPGSGESQVKPGGNSGSAAGNPTLPDELVQKPGAEPAADAGNDEPPPHEGPWLVVTSIAAAVYEEPHFVKEKKIGYVRNGGRVPVKAKPVSTENCSGGWYEIVDGGYICANQGTTDLNHPQVKFAIKQPDLEAVLPYHYARNAKNGTPLYKSVPSREQMREYEPYLDSSKKKKSEEKAEAKADDEQDTEAAALSSDAGVQAAVSAALADAGIALPSAADAGDEPEKPWWQREDAKDKLHEVTLEHLSADADDVLAKRMVAGFYVAIDKTFSWNNRTWYKTTKGLVAPADRFWQTSGSSFHGVKLDGEKYHLPLAWVYGGRKTAPSYSLDKSSGKLSPARAIERFEAIQLTGKEREQGGIKYSETKHGVWIKNIHIRVTHPGPPPADLAPNERWVDVNRSEQTLVMFEGTRAIYATLVSTGKHSSIKDKDHSTPTGEWRIREKHITTTMDGDGTAAGDLPYSIEDVPYVMYYHRSYALHGAFWHRNYGVEMSHGCVNLAPLDAKEVLLFTEPRMPRGWHGVWANKSRPGSRVIVHD